MTHSALRIVSAGIAITAVAVISLATDNTVQSGARTGDPSVPTAWEVFHANDGRSEGNVEDKSY